MNEKITEAVHGIMRLKYDDRELFGFRISASRKPDAHTISRKRNDVPAYIVRGQDISEWQTDRVIEHEGRYLVGENHLGIPLYEVLEKPAEEAAVYLKRLFDALILLRERTGVYPAIHSNAVIFTQDAGVFFLVNSTLDRFHASLRDNEQLEYYEKYNDRLRDSASGLSFSFAAMLYPLLCGKSPYNGKTVGELRHAVSRKKIVPPHTIVPEISESLSRAITDCLKGGALRPDEWPALLDMIADGSWKTKPSPEKKRELLADGERLERLYNKSARIESFFRRYRNVMIGAGIVMIFVAGIMYSYIVKLLEPPVTVGMTPIEVVGLFYESIDSFDHFSLEDTVTRAAGADRINEAVHMFAYSRVIEGYEGGGNPYINVQEWTDAGRPELPSGRLAYGIANLSITAEADNVFLAEYEKWIHESLDGGDGGFSFVLNGYSVRERLFLEWRKNAWIITKIEEISLEKIP